jgi:gamma-glutamyltranspeptidase/glutathione hydrolase
MIGAASASTAMALRVGGAHAALAAENDVKPQGGNAMRIREDMLKNRNRNRSTVACRHGIVCTSQPLASIAGTDVLKSGGNAIDAAICANAMLSVVEPMNCGPGGDLFAIVWIEKEHKLFGLNASGRAPYDWDLNAAKEKGLASIPGYSTLAWNVPGCVSGWEALLNRFGSRTPAQLLDAPIRYAREGFPVSPIIADDWPFNAQQFPTLAKTFMPDGKAPRFGDMFTHPRIGDLFELLAKQGFRAFYEGEVAERIVKFSKANGGYFSLRDFSEHKATWVEPAGTNYRGYDVWEIPPNGQGISVLQILNMLETFDIAALGPNSREQLHLFIEAKKLAYEDRATYYADMDFADVPLAWLISKEYGKERAKRIDPKRAATDVLPGEPSAGETIYLTTADDQGNMVSLIQSIYHGWGSHIVPDDLGFAVQNRGMSFSLDPAHRNKLEPHKRPFHTIIPAFVTKENRPIFAFGVMGGDFQPQGHSQVLMNLIDFGMSPQQAGDQPRVEHGGSSSPTGTHMQGGGVVNLEMGIPDATRQALADMGHKVSDGVDVFGGYQGIWREENPRRYFGGSDPRKDGCAIGY